MNAHTASPAATPAYSRAAEDLIARIRAREQAATPGPWRWRGNTDTGEPYLTSGGTRADSRGRVRHAGDVLGLVLHEVTREEAFRRSVDEADVDLYLTGEDGGPRQERRLAFCVDGIYTDAASLAVFEVAPDAHSREDPRVYRADITGIRHPDAEFIACARQDLARALDALDGVLALASQAERQALRWHDPLPVPGWVAQIRDVIARGLAGQASHLRKGGDHDGTDEAAAESARHHQRPADGQPAPPCGQGQQRADVQPPQRRPPQGEH